jgi:hypothetical protein
LPGSLEKDILHFLPKGDKESVQRGRESEDHMKIPARGKPLPDLPYPQFAFLVLTFGTVMVAAGTVTDMFMAAVHTLLFLSARRCRAAQADCFQRFLLKKGWSVLFFKGRAKAADYVCRFKMWFHLR